MTWFEDRLLEVRNPRVSTFNLGSVERGKMLIVDGLIDAVVVAKNNPYWKYFWTTDGVKRMYESVKCIFSRPDLSTLEIVDQDVSIFLFPFTHP